MRNNIIVKNNLAVEGLKTFKNQTYSKKSLRFVNWLTDEQFGFLMEALTKNCSVKTLFMLRNINNDERIKQFSEMLKINESIETLILAMNKIQDEGAVHIAKALIENKSLYELDIRGNQIQSQGIQDLIAAFKMNKTCLKLKVATQKKRVLEEISAIERDKKKIFKEKLFEIALVINQGNENESLIFFTEDILSKILCYLVPKFFTNMEKKFKSLHDDVHFVYHKRKNPNLFFKHSQNPNNNRGPEVQANPANKFDS